MNMDDLPLLAFLFGGSGIQIRHIVKAWHRYDTIYRCYGDLPALFPLSMALEAPTEAWPQRLASRPPYHWPAYGFWI